MKVIGINGSPRKGGNTETIIRKTFEPLEAAGIETELIQIGGKAIRGCTACGKCALDAADGVIVMQDGLAIVDVARQADASVDAVERCPTGAIVWFDPEKGSVTGRAARKVVRQSARHVAPT